MRAELVISLKSAVSTMLLVRALREALGNSSISPLTIAIDPLIYPYRKQVVAAAMYPDDARVLFLHTTANQMTIIIAGNSIGQLKKHCETVMIQLASLGLVRVTSASACLIISAEGQHLAILTGEQYLWIRELKAALRDKSVSKVLPSAITAGLAIYYFVPGSQAVTSGLIALAASCVGACAEAGLETYSPDIWKWKGFS